MKIIENPLLILSVLVLGLVSCNRENKRSDTDSFTGIVLRDSIFKIEMIDIPAGHLRMEKGLMEHSMDIHIESFSMGKYEVIQKQWREVMGAYPERTWPVARRRVYRGSHYLHTKFAASYNWSHSYSQVYPHHCVGFRLVREKKSNSLMLY